MATSKLCQPPWWPRAACGLNGVGKGELSVPGFEQIIVGCGRSGIGMHADQYVDREMLDQGIVNVTSVNSSLMVAYGVKHVVMLPPECGGRVREGTLEAEVRNALGKSRWPLTWGLARRILRAGGYIFDLGPGFLSV